MSEALELRSMSREMMWRMIPEVPSRIRIARTSRQMRSMGSSFAIAGAAEELQRAVSDTGHHLGRD
jgi:hypothetical protein